MDIVYTLRDGENPELRYSLRTLKNVEHDKVWIFGGCPQWVNEETVEVRRRSQNGSPYTSTRAHIAAACNTPEVSDPFLLWNDDFFAMEPIEEVPVLHRGSLDGMLEQFAALKTGWAKGLRETATLIRETPAFVEPVSYDLHVPLIIHKARMQEALRLAKKIKTDAVHIRTIYGNLVPLGGTETPDVKMHRRSDPFPRGPWLSSGDDTFRSSVEPVLRYLFPDPSPYEKV